LTRRSSVATYSIAFTTTASSVVEVEADSLEEAEEKAWNSLSWGLCNQCSSGSESVSGVELSGDWDTDTSHFFRDGEYVEGFEESE
jgi:hypothetical protein